LRYGKRQPDGFARLSCNILIIDVSATTVPRLLSGDVEALEISLWNGERDSEFNNSHSADGIFFACKLTGRGVDTSGSSSVINPLGNGFVLFTRKN
jgi:hypothetical protein